MGLLPDIGYPQTGDKAKSGMYACMNCSHDKPNDENIAYLPTDSKLPECPVCGHTYWMKI